MLCPNYTEELIGLKDLYVKSVERIGQKLYIYTDMYQRIHKCPHCGERTSKVHDRRTQKIKDISAFGEMTIICPKKRRHVCTACAKKFYENRRKVQYFVMDMSGSYKHLAQILFPSRQDHS